jgi:hypothetical protein
MMRFQRLLLVLCAFPSLASIASGQEFYLREDDRVLFHGEAIPGDRLFESFIETFAITRFPQWNLLFIHSVWSGNPPPAALSNRPTAIVATLGASDAGGDAEAVNGYRNLIQGLTASFPRARITALQLTAPLREGSGGGNGVGDSVAPAGARGAAAGSAQSENTTLVDVIRVDVIRVDVIRPIQAAVEKAKARDLALAARILLNGVPAGEAGQLLMAQSLLQAWHAPALVTSVEIDALRGRVTRAENTTVRELESGRVIAWSQDDRALPMPVDFTDPTVALAASCSDFIRVLDQETLRIRGMAAEWYRLTIDGEPLGFFSRSRLDEGINLAALATPMWKQAMAVHALSRKHADLQAAGARLFQAPVEERQSRAWKAALEALTAAEAELIDEQRTKAQPKTHDYELQPVEN